MAYVAQPNRAGKGGRFRSVGATFPYRTNNTLAMRYICDTYEIHAWAQITTPSSPESNFKHHQKRDLTLDLTALGMSSQIVFNFGRPLVLTSSRPSDGAPQILVKVQGSRSVHGPL